MVFGAESRSLFSFSVAWRSGKNELRLLQLKDFDRGRGEVTIHGKGGKVIVLPLGFDDLKGDLNLELLMREPTEYLLYPKEDPERPFDPASLHRWFKRALERADLPAGIKIHELRHSAADALWRETGDLLKAQQLLRHESVSTTQAYLHPTREDLRDALARLPQVVRWSEGESA